MIYQRNKSVMSGLWLFCLSSTVVLVVLSTQAYFPYFKQNNVFHRQSYSQMSQIYSISAWIVLIQTCFQSFILSKVIFFHCRLQKELWISASGKLEKRKRFEVLCPRVLPLFRAGRKSNVIRLKIVTVCS